MSVEYSSNEIKVGAMLVLGFGLLVVFIIAIFGVNWREQTKEYETFLRQIPGIEEGSLVKFGGMDVGHVSEISLPDNPQGEPLISLKLKVDAKTPVRANSLAYVTSVSIMATQHIEISPGTPDVPLLPDGGVLQSKEVLSFTQMAEPFSEMSAKVEVLIERLSDVFNTQNRQHLASMISNMDKVMNEGGDRFIVLVENLERLTNNLSEVSRNLNVLMSDNKENFNETLEHLEITSRESSALSAEMRKSLNEFDKVVSANGASFVEIMENFQYTSQNLEEFSRIVKERPWLLVRKDAPPERELP